jgi:hypothetical protein
MNVITMGDFAITNYQGQTVSCKNKFIFSRHYFVCIDR